MADHDNRTVICSVAFIEIVEFSKKSVEEQMRAKEQLNSVLAQALEDVAAHERIILDTAEGAAISFHGDPDECLFFALALRDALAARSDEKLRVRTGINLGPVRLTKYGNGQPNLMGDGLNVAQRVMRFANIDQLLVSGSFFDALAARSADYAGLFTFEGARTDQHVREHQVYSLGKASRRQRMPRKQPGPSLAHPRAALRKLASVAQAGRLQVMRYPPLATALAVLLVLMLSVALRQMLHGTANDHVAEPASQVASQLPPPPEPPLPVVGKATTEPPVEAAPPSLQTRETVAPPANTRPAPPVAATGSVRFTITPWGEVHIDGEKIGVAPPLRDVALNQGRHRIEVHNPGFAPYQQVINVAAGEQIRIRHQFR